MWKVISEGLAAGLGWVCSESPEPGAGQGPPSWALSPGPGALSDDCGDGRGWPHCARWKGKGLPLWLSSLPPSFG